MKILLAETGERTEIFRRVFDTDIFNKITINLNSKQREAKEQLQELKVAFATNIANSSLEEKIDSKEINELYIKEVTEKLKTKIEVDKAEFHQTDKEAKDFERECKKFEENQKEKIDIKKAVDILQKTLATLEKSLRELLEEETKSKKYSKNLKVIRENLKSYQDQKKKNQEQEEKIQRLREIVKLQNEHEKQGKEYNLQQEAYKQENLNYLEKEEEFFREQAGILALKLEDNKPCPVCGSTLHPKPAQKSQSVLSKEELDVLKKKLEDKQKSLNSLKEKITDLNSRAKTLTEELNLENDVVDEGKKLSKELEEGKEKLQIYYEKIDEAYQDISGKKINLDSFDFDQYQEEVNNKVLEIKENITKAKTLKEEREKEFKEKSKKIENIDFEKIEEELKANKKSLEEKRKESVNAKMKLENNKNTLEKIEKISEKLVNTIKEYNVLDELYRTASGNLPGKSRINFEQYIQTNYFDMVVQEANKRFLKMTDGRFQLFRKEASSRISDKIALELEVLDYYNGKRRDVKSLSGGEAFKAALCLALGLSDIIQSYSGGVQVDTLFIDEGFGSLDAESREQAINTLNQLAGSNKLIGIISHVSELQDRIDKKIIVEKGIDGSKIRGKMGRTTFP